MKMQTIPLALALALCPAGRVSAQVMARQPAPMPPVVMEDQFERGHNLAALSLRGDVAVLIFGDRESATADKLLGEQLHVTFHPTAKGQPPAQARQAPVRPLPGLPEGARSPDVHFVAIACIGDVPNVVRSVIRTQIRNSSPDVPVWLDFQDQMKGQLGVTPGVPNVAVVDAAGHLRYSASGHLTTAQLNQLFAAIEGLRHEAAQTGPR
jgi:hypothetical protein